MTKRYLFTLITVLALMILAACSSLQLPGSQDASGQSEVDALGSQPVQAIEDKLAIGTLLLEGTDQALTPEQAQTLLPLWKGVKALSASETASPEEIAALYDQIQEAMTADQIQTIEAMNLSPEEMQALMEKYGVQFQRPEGDFNPGNLSEDERTTRIAQFQAQGGGRGNFVPGEGPPGGPGMGRFSGGFSPEGGFPEGMGRVDAQGTPVAPIGGRGFRGRFSLILVDPLIELLQERAGS